MTTARRRADNPFIGRAGHKPEVYTFGHRNSLGLAVHPATGEMWQSEMGPNGGDEINILKPGANYGWPIVSLGRSYPGPWQSPTFSKEGIRIAGRVLDAVHLPVRHDLLHGQQAPEVEGRHLRRRTAHRRDSGTGHLERVLVNDKLEELRRESLLVPLRMRIRDVRQGPDELLYVLVDHENGGVLRIEPSATQQKPTNYSARPAR